MSSPMSTTHSPTSTASDNMSESVSGRRKCRVSAEHTLNRVRENQRRHRARQRDHVASLELKLAETEKQLAEARAEIAVLKAERDTESAICRYSHITASVFPMPSDVYEATDERANTFQQKSVTQINPHLEYLEGSSVPAFGAANSPGFIIELNDNMPLPPALGPYVGPPPCCSDTPVLPPQNDPADPECSSCKTRPPPDPAESTTLCAQAFILISQQNFRNLDPGTIRAWLAQGLRRAQREGEGCRVENGALLRLLDFISGV